MSVTVWFDKERVLSAVRQGMEEGLDEAADRIAADAKRRAPIRKVFREKHGFRPRVRSLTPAEKSIAIARATHYYTHIRPDTFALRRSIAHTQHYAKVRLPTRGSANNLSVSRKKRILGTERAGRFTGVGGTRRNSYGGFEPGEALGKQLSSRGKYEVRSGRAIHLVHTKTSTKVQVGGALKASIGNEGVVQTGKGMKATVAAAIYYAKYVEFPTVRTRAQPFLLPALMGERERLPKTIAAAIKRNLGG